ncbi:hypothetical protein [Prauserella cavernicola]|uniref:Uncharacterized protein n=1 Tax=Prauserella cavernicola TaxID=2800127 RepID=A0A934QXI9_9PSEU|nr:hypothetical protein [Prauserella cavernicola]MBK1788328.1 hypothetical protein [Prauserella cavernicola]
MEPVQETRALRRYRIAAIVLGIGFSVATALAVLLLMQRADVTPPTTEGGMTSFSRRCYSTVDPC